MDFLAYTGIGIALVGLAIFMSLFPPKKRNHYYGYRTPISLKNDTNWKIAQVFSTKVLFLIGPFVFLINLFFFIKQVSLNVNMAVSLILLFAAIAFIEFYLRSKLN